MVLNLLENGNYNSNLVWINQIQYRFPFVESGVFSLCFLSQIWRCQFFSRKLVNVSNRKKVEDFLSKSDGNRIQWINKYYFIYLFIFFNDVQTFVSMDLSNYRSNLSSYFCMTISLEKLSWNLFYIKNNYDDLSFQFQKCLKQFYLQRF